MVVHVVTHDPNDPDFPHGEPRGWRRGCRCDSCDAAFKARHRGYRALLSASNPRGKVPADKPRRHVQALVDAGWAMTQIAAAAGLSVTAVQNIRHPIRKDVTRETAYRIAQVTPETLADRVTRVDRDRVHRQIHALHANGWRASDLAPMLGISAEAMRHRSGVGRAMRGISAERAAAVDALYKRIGDQPGPSKRVATRARKQGWYPPIFCDDGGNLIPEAVPTRNGYGTKQARQAQTMATAVAKVQLRFRVLRLLLTHSHVQAATLAGVDPKTVERVAREVGFTPDTSSAHRNRLWAALNAAEIAPEDDLPALWATVRGNAHPQPVDTPVDTGVADEAA